MWWAVHSRNWRRLRRRGAGALDAELLYPMAKRVGMHMEERRRAFGPLDHASGQLEGSQNMISLDLPQRRESRCRQADWLSLFRLALGGLMTVRGDRNRSQLSLQLENPALTQNDCSFDHVLELTDVPRPGVGQNLVHRVFGDPVDALAELLRVL